MILKRSNMLILSFSFSALALAVALFGISPKTMIVLAILVSMTYYILMPYKYILYSIVIFSFAVGYAIEFEIAMGISGLWIIGGIVPLIIIGNIIINKHKLNQFTSEHIIYLVFLAYSCLAFSFPEGGDLLSKLSLFAKLVNGFFALVLGSIVLNTIDEQRKLPYFFIIAMLTMVIISLPDVMSGGVESHRWIGGERVHLKIVSGGFYSARYFAFGIVLSLPMLILGYVSSETAKLKTIFALALIAGSLLLYYTYRRTMWAGAIVIWITWIWYYLKKNVKSMKIIGIGVTLFVIIAFSTAWVVANIGSHFSDSINLLLHLPTALSESSYDYVLTGRWGIFRNAYIATIIDQPIYNTLFGRGIGSTALILYDAGFSVHGGHSNYFVLLMDFGVIGSSIYLWLICSIFWKAKYVLKNENDEFKKMYSVAAISLIYSYFVMSITEHLIWHLVQFNWLIWIILAPIMILYENIKSDKKA